MERTNSTGTLTPVERFLLTRLERFTRIAATAEASAIPQWRKLARHASAGAYRDCLNAGLEAEARDLLKLSSSDEEALSA